MDDGAQPAPPWLADAVEEGLRDALKGVAEQNLVDVEGLGADGLRVLRHLDPELLAERRQVGVLIHGVLAAHRIVAHVQAVKHRWIAALSRPGVVMPLQELVDACVSEPGGLSRPFRTPDELPSELLATGDGGNGSQSTTINHLDDAQLVRLLDHPEWSLPLGCAAAQVAAAEVGCVLAMAPVSARRCVEEALTMVERLPATLSAQESGEIDGFRASIIAQETECLSQCDRRVVERTVSGKAASLTPGRLRNLARRAAIAADPAAAERRVRRAKASRGVHVDKADDDMAVFRAHLPAPDAQLAHGVLNEIATSLTAAGLAGGRGRSQLRADVFTDIFRSLAETGTARIDAGGSAASSGHRSGSDDAPDAATPVGGGDRARASKPRRQVCLNVYVTASTLARFDDDAGELAGYGAITAETARALAESADTVRAMVVGHCECRNGEPLGTVGASCGAGRVDSDDPPDSAHAHRPSMSAGPPGSSGSAGTHSVNPARTRLCGTVLDAGRAVYRPRAACADYVTARDRTCQFPGCAASATRCDIDHREAFDEGGASCPCNLDLLCRFHHRLKTFTPWRATPGRDGRLVWISPSGREYSKESSHVIDDVTVSSPARMDAAQVDTAQRITGHAGSSVQCSEPPPF